MRKVFVKTENYVSFIQALQAVEQRGAAEAGMMLVYGLPGSGKSQVVSRWASDAGAVFLRANVDWTPRYFLTELSKALELEPRGSSSYLFTCLIDRLAGSMIPLVVDEAEFTLPNNAAVLEKVRDFSDRAELTVVLIGMERIRQRIARHQQIFSRIAQVVEFKPATLADVSRACGQLAEVGMTAALMAEVHRISGGRMREALNVIAAIERIAKLNGLEEVDVPDLEGAALSYDWRNQTPKTVQSSPAPSNPVRAVRATAGGR